MEQAQRTLFHYSCGLVIAHKEKYRLMKLLKLMLVVLFVLIAGVMLFHQKVIALLVLPPYIDWATQTEAQGLVSGVALEAKQLLIAKEIGIKQPEKIRLVYVEQVPFPHDNALLKTVGEALGFIGDGIVNNAQVFGYSIYVRTGYELTTPRLAHELVHVLQIERSSLEAVVTQHFSDLATYGYNDSPLEVEAYKANQHYKDR